MTTTSAVPEQKSDIQDQEPVLTEKLVTIRRVSKVVKGGRRFSFSALVVVGDHRGSIGIGLENAKEVPEAIRKAGAAARKNLIKVPLVRDTIPHPITAKFGAAVVLLKPAMPGTGIVAGGGVRAVVEMAGIKNILTKSLGCSNPINVVKATALALSKLRNLETELARRGKAAAKR